MRWCTCRQRGPRTGHLQQPLSRSCERHQGLRSVRLSTRSSERLNDMLVLPYWRRVSAVALGRPGPAEEPFGRPI